MDQLDYRSSSSVVLRRQTSSFSLRGGMIQPRRVVSKLTEIHARTSQTSSLAETIACNIFSADSVVRCENEGRDGLDV